MAAAAAAAALRSLGSRLKGLQSKVVMSKEWIHQDLMEGLWVPEDARRKEGRFRKLKERMVWSFDRAKGEIRQHIIQCAVFSAWGSCGYFITKSLERVGVLDSGLSDVVKVKEQIATELKLENEKSFEKLRQKRADDRATLERLSKEFENHRKVTKLWLFMLAVEPLTKDELTKMMQADGLFTMDEVRTVLKMLGTNLSDTKLHSLVAESGMIALPELMKLISEERKKAEDNPKEEIVSAEDNPKEEIVSAEDNPKEEITEASSSSP